MSKITPFFLCYYLPLYESTNVEYEWKCFLKAVTSVGWKNTKKLLSTCVQNLSSSNRFNSSQAIVNTHRSLPKDFATFSLPNLAQSGHGFAVKKLTTMSIELGIDGDLFFNCVCVSFNEHREVLQVFMNSAWTEKVPCFWKENFKSSKALNFCVISCKMNANASE